ncbi:hypothetical protein D3C87_1410500 [compost metagenome]
MKILVLVAGLLLTSVSQAREIQYSCTSYHDKSTALRFNVDSKTLYISGSYEGTSFEGASTSKIKPGLHLPFGDGREQRLELYFDVKSRVGSVYSTKDLQVVFQGYCS